MLLLKRFFGFTLRPNPNPAPPASRCQTLARRPGHLSAKPSSLLKRRLLLKLKLFDFLACSGFSFGLFFLGSFGALPALCWAFLGSFSFSGLLPGLSGLFLGPAALQEFYRFRACSGIWPRLSSWAPHIVNLGSQIVNVGPADCQFVTRRLSIRAPPIACQFGLPRSSILGPQIVNLRPLDC